MVFQSYTLFPWLTVLKNVMFGLEVSGAASSSEAQGEAKMWLELVGPVASSRPRTRTSCRAA